MTNIKNNLMPDFIVIGAGKSGTTSLYYYLKQHPQIFMTEVKEPNFFALEGKVFSAEDEKDDKAFFPWAVKDIESYRNLYKDATSDKLKGESSTMYLYMDQAPMKIKSYVPKVKLIAIFRQPAERLYSRYLHLARDNRLPTKEFKDALVKGNIWWERNDLVKEGFYYKHLSRYYELFPKENILVFLYEDLINDPQAVLKAMYEYLEVDSTFKPDTKMKFNESGFIKNKYFDSLVGRNSGIKNTIKKVLPGVFKQVKSNYLVKNLVNKLRKVNLERPPLSADLKRQITNDIYRDDIIKFQKLINRDLSKWLP